MNEEELEKAHKKQNVNNGLLVSHKTLIKELNKAAEDLSPMKKEFCHAMLTAESQTAAAITAGYSPQSAKSKASQLLVEPAVQHYLGLLGLMRSQVVALDTKQIQSLQLKQYYECVSEGNLKEANVALNQLAKMSGVYDNSALAKAPSAKEVAQMPDKEKDNEVNEMAELLKLVEERKESGT